MHPTDLARELAKAHLALGHAAAYLQRHNEANAVLHLAGPGGVMYSPLTSEVVTAHATLGAVIERLAQEASEPLTEDWPGEPDTVALVDDTDEPDPALADADTGDAPEVPMRWDGKPAVPVQCVRCGKRDPEGPCPDDEAGAHHLEPVEAGDG